MKKSLISTMLFCAMVCIFNSCSKQANQVEVQSSQVIKLSAPEDQFLLNFIEPGPDGLSIGISREEALFAGASKAGYADFRAQIERINEMYNAESYKYWTEATRQRQVATKAAAFYEETYDIYNVPEQDHFLENFVYFENGKTFLKISEEKAVLCGATINGYQALYDLIITNETWDKMVREGYTTYEELRQAFDKKRASILHSNTVFSDLPENPIVTPPQTYATIELRGSNRQESCSFYGSEEVVGVLSSNYFCSMATLKEQDTGKTLNLLGYNTSGRFKAGLIYPEGGHYSFIFTKGTDGYDVFARLVEVPKNPEPTL